jgi:hypothetical protein
VLYDLPDHGELAEKTIGHSRLRLMVTESQVEERVDETSCEESKRGWGMQRRLGCEADPYGQST